MSCCTNNTADVSGVSSGLSVPLNPDRIGVLASTLCAIHCVVTPFLLMGMPAFGRIWAHPASHWVMALLVVPIAAFMMSKGYKRHRRAWILGIGTAGILFVLAGAVVPHFIQDGHAHGAAPLVADVHHGAVHTDECCPSVVQNDDGSKGLSIPATSILTTAGGLLLIVTHIGNICSCSSCGRKSGKAATNSRNVS